MAQISSLWPHETLLRKVSAVQEFGLLMAHMYSAWIFFHNSRTSLFPVCVREIGASCYAWLDSRQLRFPARADSAVQPGLNLSWVPSLKGPSVMSFVPVSSISYLPTPPHLHALIGNLRGQSPLGLWFCWDLDFSHTSFCISAESHFQETFSCYKPIIST